MSGKETAQEGEGEIRQRYREQHAASPTVKCDGRLFVAASDESVRLRAGRCHTHNWRFPRV